MIVVNENVQRVIFGNLYSETVLMDLGIIVNNIYIILIISAKHTHIFELYALVWYALAYRFSKSNMGKDKVQ